MVCVTPPTWIVMVYSPGGVCGWPCILLPDVAHPAQLMVSISIANAGATPDGSWTLGLVRPLALEVECSASPHRLSP
jgi:hypothetical protein